MELPSPIREEVDVENQQELNELETIQMFQYHTWRGYRGGMNLTLPGSIDYKNVGILQPIESRRKIGQKLKEQNRGLFGLTEKQKKEVVIKGGKTTGAINLASGRWAVVSQLCNRVVAAKKAGAIARDTGQINRIQSKDASRRGGITQGNKAVESGQWDEIKGLGLHTRWHVSGTRCGRSTRFVGPKPNPQCVFCSEQNLVIAFA